MPETLTQDVGFVVPASPRWCNEDGPQTGARIPRSDIAGISAHRNGYFLENAGSSGCGRNGDFG